MPTPKKSPAVKKVPKAAPSRKSVPAKKMAPVKKVAPLKKASKKAGTGKSGRSVESLIRKRDIDLKSVEEALGLNQEATKGKPVIPGKFDLLIPPGVPRKIILDMANEYGLEIVERNDFYVPIGVCDIEREVLAFRGDKKTISKLEKILLQELADFEKTGKVEGFRVIP